MRGGLSAIFDNVGTVLSHVYNRMAAMLNLPQEKVAESTEHRLVIRVRPWSRNDWIFVLPGLVLGSLLALYLSTFITSWWRFGLYFASVYMAGAFAVFYRDVSEETTWIFDGKSGRVSVFTHRLLAESCTRKCVSDYPLSAFTDAEVETHDANIRFVYRVVLLQKDGERVPLRSLYDIERSGKDRAAAAIRAFLAQHAASNA